MVKSGKNIYTQLPSHVTSQIAVREDNEQYVLNFLQNVLPNSDLKSISDELKKTFIFSKLKVKQKGKIQAKGRFLSGRKRIQFGLGKIGIRHGMKYSDLLPLNQLWLDYMRKMLGKKFDGIPRDPMDPNWENVNQQLVKADLHGALISVVRSKCPSLVGISGIVIQDTKNAFRICCADNIIRTIPKDTVVLNIHLDQVKLQVFGKELSIRPTERSVKKLKNARISEL